MLEHSPFFNLPREIRDLVYHFLWQGHPDIGVPYLNKRSILRYGSTNQACTKDVILRDSNTLPVWLFISKAFFHEATAVLNEQAEWIWIPHGRTRANTGSATLFGPSTAQTITLKLGNLGPITHWPITQRSLAQMTRDIIVDHHRIAEDMLANEKVQDLHFWLELEDEADFDTFGNFADMDTEFLEPFQYIPIRNVVIYVEDDEGLQRIEVRRRKNLNIGFLRIAEAILGTGRAKACLEKHCKHAEYGEDYMVHWIRFRKDRTRHLV